MPEDHHSDDSAVMSLMSVSALPAHLEGTVPDTPAPFEAADTLPQDIVSNWAEGHQGQGLHWVDPD